MKSEMSHKHFWDRKADLELENDENHWYRGIREMEGIKESIKSIIEVTKPCKGPSPSETTAVQYYRILLYHLFSWHSLYIKCLISPADWAWSMTARGTAVGTRQRWEVWWLLWYKPPSIDTTGPCAADRSSRDTSSEFKFIINERCFPISGMKIQILFCGSIFTPGNVLFLGVVLVKCPGTLRRGLQAEHFTFIVLLFTMNITQSLDSITPNQ